MMFSDIIFTPIGKEQSQSALYRCSDGGLYHIISIDTDSAVMCSADMKKFTVAAKPYFDGNVLDCSSLEHFGKYSEAMKYKKELQQIFEFSDMQDVQIYDEIMQNDISYSDVEDIRLRKKLL